ncbi:MAG: polysaccharide deacetylase [Planctomyces sp.]|nr:polysaccharide deacetylase [Planctomyces sp.]
MPWGYSKQELFAKALTTSGCGSLLRRCPTWRGVLILNYHRIGDGSNSLLDRELWSASIEDFEYQVRRVSLDFDVIGPNDLTHAFNQRRGRYVMLTFDDGYIDNYEFAYPILKAFNTTCVFFLTTGFIDQRSVPWWDEIAWMVRTSRGSGLAASEWIPEPIAFDEPDRQRAVKLLLKRYKILNGSRTKAYVEYLADALGTGRAPTEIGDRLWMDWNQIREMQRDGMVFGGHTSTHPILANLSRAEQDVEIGTCQARLTEELGHPCRWFSFPVGGRGSFNNDTRELLAYHGFDWSFTYFGGYGQAAKLDPHAVPRTAVETHVTRDLFDAILTLPQCFTRG